MKPFAGHLNEAGEWVVRAPAKINLWLRVHGKRGDGYHELSTLMMALELGDSLRGHCTADDCIHLKLEGPQASVDIPNDRRNLVWQAVHAVRELARSRGQVVPAGVRVFLHKNVPSQAGLGGGSSDAAAALALAEQLLGLDGGEDWRRATLLRLGADCSFFQGVGQGSLALCEGIGERVSPWGGEPLPWHVVLLVPAVTCPTGKVFGAVAGSARVAGDFPFDSVGALSCLPLPKLRALLSTDLEPAALQAVPGLQPWRAFLDRENAEHFCLSGSGSAFFGLFENAEIARGEQQRLVAACGAQGLSLRANFVTTARGLGRTGIRFKKS